MAIVNKALSRCQVADNPLEGISLGLLHHCERDQLLAAPELGEGLLKDVSDHIHCLHVFLNFRKDFARLPSQ